METQVEAARSGRITSTCQTIAALEGLDHETMRKRVAEGSVVFMVREDVALGIGKGLRTKVNVNLGTSTHACDPTEEIMKVEIAERHGADTITDLSMGGDISAIRKMVFDHSTLPVCTVPLYQAVAENGLADLREDDIIKALRTQVLEGVGSVILHCVDNRTLKSVLKKERILGVVSRGGSIMGAYMMRNRCENPFIEHFETVLSLLKSQDVVLSLGNTVRSGCIHDGWDRAQILEMKGNANLARKAHEAGVQVIIEGCGGHMRADRIASTVRRYKKTSPSPLFVAGPLPLDIAMGYDHIAGAVGASIASGAGADYLCYITPAEHLGLPNPEQVREGLIAFKIAAHIGDSMKYGISEKDAALSRKRVAFDLAGQIPHAIDTIRAEELCPSSGPCTMCGNFCPIRIMRGYAGKKHL
ncbi:MAG: phosphomethylpyrimidine synthase ThiC [Methanomicrobiales archaeon]|nr:phosphomethylpyrimidine synthase ThiC [Methanomicrobiales archaeon]